MKKRSRKEKFAIIATSAILGVCAAMASYSYFLSDLTEWQKSRDIDFSTNTGSTKFKARVDALSVGGATFCVSAIMIMATMKFRKNK